MFVTKRRVYPGPDGAREPAAGRRGREATPALVGGDLEYKYALKPPAENPRAAKWRAIWTAVRRFERTQTLSSRLLVPVYSYRRMLMEGSRFVGLDLGKRTYAACVSHDGAVVQHWSGTTDGSGLQRLALQLGPGDVVALEAGPVAFRVARNIQSIPRVRPVVLNPRKLAIIYASTKKTDAHDARKLARLVEMMPEGYLPIVSVPSVDQEELRRLSGGPVFLKNERNRVINRLHGLFVSAGLTTVRKKTLAQEGPRRGALEQLPGVYGRLAQHLVAILAEVEHQILEADREIRAALTRNSDDATLLLSVPGIGPATAAAFLGYVGDGSRFASASQVSCYVGMIPRIDSSGETTRLGHITKNGNATLRRALVQAAWAAIRSRAGTPFREVFDRIAYRRGTSIAIVAVARRMLELMYTLLRRREYYRYGTLSERLQKLRRYKLAIAGTGGT